MEDLFSNGTINASKNEGCKLGPHYLVTLSLIDIILLLLGQPVITKLLWIVFTSKKTIDILNCNLALFHNFQYLISIMHLIVLFALPEVQTEILVFWLVLAQIGGPMSLAFICMERYVAVIHPMSYPLLKKYRFREVCAVSVWLLSVPSALAFVLIPDAPSFLKDKVLKPLPFFVLIFMTMMVMRCSISIAGTLKKSGPGKDKLHSVKRRAFKTVCATAVITLLFYSPVTILQKSNNVTEIIYVCIFTPICIFLLSAASVVHPLFYLSAQGKFLTCFKSEKNPR